MLENSLTIPEPMLAAIQRMRYEGEEFIDYYLACDVQSGQNVSTIPLVRVPMGSSPDMSVEADQRSLDALARYLDADSVNSAIFLHFHPLKGPSAEDERVMTRMYGETRGKIKCGIFVGPEGPTFYETDGKTVFTMRANLETISMSNAISGAQQEAYKKYQAGLQ